MRYCTVFQGCEIVAESDGWIPSKSWPDGAYARNEFRDGTRNWYVKRWGSAIPINTSEVPKEIRLLLLLLEVPV